MEMDAETREQAEVLLAELLGDDIDGLQAMLEDLDAGY